MKKFLTALLIAAIAPFAGAGAEDLAIEGLGTLPFGKDIHVTDGRGTAVEEMMRRNFSAAIHQDTKESHLMHFLTVPEGMILSHGSDSPLSRVRVYQLVQQDMRTTYTMMVFVFSGDEEELFRGKKEKISFWDRAFRKEESGPAMPGRALNVEEFRQNAERAMEEGRGAAPDFRILDGSSWKKYTNEDGTLRWQQQVKSIVTNEKGLVMPLWTESVLYRNLAGRYYFLIFTGSHQSGRKLSDAVLYGLYQLRREKL